MNCFTEERAATSHRLAIAAHSDRIATTASVVALSAISEHPLQFGGSSKKAFIVCLTRDDSSTSHMFTNLILAVRN